MLKMYSTVFSSSLKYMYMYVVFFFPHSFKIGASFAQTIVSLWCIDLKVHVYVHVCV